MADSPRDAFGGVEAELPTDCRLYMSPYGSPYSCKLIPRGANYTPAEGGGTEVTFTVRTAPLGPGGRTREGGLGSHEGITRKSTACAIMGGTEATFTCGALSLVPS